MRPTAHQRGRGWCSVSAGCGALTMHEVVCEGVDATHCVRPLSTVYIVQNLCPQRASLVPIPGKRKGEESSL